MKALSREIKFRAWNPSTKTYGYFEPFKRFELSAEPDYDGYMGKINTWRYKKGAMGDMGMYYEFSISHENVEDLVFQQYTGLHDKDGKEIYEGDIIKYDEDESINRWVSGEIAKILALPGRFTARISPFDKFNGSNQNTLNEDFEDSVTIVGNIYENPELLN